MKKTEFMEFVNSEQPEGKSLRINERCYLWRWTVDALNSPCDGLSLECKTAHGGRSFKIVAREYHAIIDEIIADIKIAQDEETEYFIRQLRGGYIG